MPLETQTGIKDQVQSRSIIDIQDSAQAIALDCREILFLVTLMKKGVEPTHGVFPIFSIIENLFANHMACLRSSVHPHSQFNLEQNRLQ